MEKTIVNKMTLYEVIAMVVPGAIIMYCIWLLQMDFWRPFLVQWGYAWDVNYLYDVILSIVVFVIADVIGLLNYWIVDGIWRLLRLRNNPRIIKCWLRKYMESMAYTNLKQLVEDRQTVWGNELTDVCGMNSELVQDIYYEAYTYALKQNARSNVPFLEHQVAMLKGLIVPLSWMVLILFQEQWYNWLLAAGVAVTLVVLAIARQKKIIALVFEDYEYEKRIDND